MDPIALVTRFYERGLAPADMNVFDELLHPDIVVRTGLSPRADIVGLATYKKIFADFADAWPVVDFVLHEVWGAGDRVAVRFTASCVFAKDYYGVKATQQIVPMEEVHLLHLRDGKIVRNVVSGTNVPMEFFMFPVLQPFVVGNLPRVETETPKRIGIVGAGKIGGNLARMFAAAGFEVLVSFGRDPAKLAALAQEPRIKAVSAEEAVAGADVVVLSVHFAAMDEAIRQMGDPNGKIVIDTSNPIAIRLPHTAMHEVQRRLPHARVVKAFNTLPANDLLSPAGVVSPICGSEQPAKIVAALVERLGFDPFVVGDASRASVQEPGGPLFGKPFTRAAAQALL